VYQFKFSDMKDALMFQITASPAAKTAFENARAARGCAFRGLILSLFRRPGRKTAGQHMCPAE